MDEVLIETLKKILAEYKACAVYVQNLTGQDYEEIKEDYASVIDDISGVLKNVKTIDDLAEMDEDTIGAVFEYLDEYATNFVISSEPEQKAKDFEEYNKLEELLALFLDEEEDDDNGEESGGND